MMILQLEADLRVAQAEFDRQYEVTKLLLDGVTTAQVHVLYACVFCFSGHFFINISDRVIFVYVFFLKQNSRTFFS